MGAAGRSVLFLPDVPLPLLQYLGLYVSFKALTRPDGLCGTAQITLTCGAFNETQGKKKKRKACGREAQQTTQPTPHLPTLYWTLLSSLHVEQFETKIPREEHILV